MSKIEIVDQFGDWRWRLSNLYWITNEQGEKVLFRPKPEQLDLLANMSGWDLVLKARQLGFTTLIDLLGLDQTVFVRDYQAAIIAHELPAVEKIFRHKVKTPWLGLPDTIKEWNPPTNMTTRELVLKNGGSIYVATSARSGTLQFLHVSEMGKIARRLPERATEIKTGCFPTVHEGGMVFVESTAEGTGGEFFDLVRDAQRLQAQLATKPRKLHRMEFKLHFYPWWREQKYRLNPEGVVIEPRMAKYFHELETEHGIKLDAEQAAWYVVMERLQKDDMKREFPSTIDEAFEGANEERYFHEQMLRARKEGRVKVIPWSPGRGVNLFFDLGRDTTAIWAHQWVAKEHRFVDYYQNSGKTLDHYAAEGQRRGWFVKNVYLPHDAKDESVVTTSTQTPYAVAKKLWPGANVRVVKRVLRKQDSIDAARNMIHESVFHEVNTSGGVDCLENYRKKWNEALGNWSDEPRHDPKSHGADAYQTFALGWEEGHEGGLLTPESFPGLTKLGAYNQ